MLLVRSGKKMVKDSNEEKTICYHCFKQITGKFCVLFRILESSGNYTYIPYCLKCAEKHKIIGEIKKTDESRNAA